LTKKLHAASAQVDALRTRVVATKEGGMITGEERLREHLANLYGEIAGYEGRPTQTQIERTDALTRELADVTRDFDAWLKNELPPINAPHSRKNSCRKSKRSRKARATKKAAPRPKVRRVRG
jgi:hypothetical protein